MIQRNRKKSIRSYIYDKANLREACYVSYQGKSARQRRKAEVRAVMDDLETFVERKNGEIRSGTYRVGDYRHFLLKDRKKRRRISVLPYGDRGVQNLYKAGIEPVIPSTCRRAPFTAPTAAAISCTRLLSVYKSVKSIVV